MDAHLNGEPDSVAGPETRKHLKECPGCAALLEESLRVRALVRRTVRGVEAPPRVEVAVRAMLRQ